MEKILSFLEELSKNNNREWFQDNRPRYQEAQTQLLGFLEEMIPRMADVDPAIKDLQPKQCVFRIYRDVRFSKDKRPYKTNFGASINRGGRKISAPGYYLHLEPGKSFILRTFFIVFIGVPRTGVRFWGSYSNSLMA